MPQKPTELDPTANALAFFGAELRHYRTRAKLSQGLLGERVYCSGSLVGLIEKAQRMPPLDFAQRCDDVLETGSALERLWPLVSKDAHPSWFRPFVDIEENATKIREWEPMVIPGLLQTEGYARALITAWQTGDGAGIVDQRVAARMERQRLLQRDSPPLLWTVVSEVALRCPVGGAEVMREQLGRLADAAVANPKVIVQVVPLSVGAHPGLAGPLELVTRHGEPDIAYFEVQGRSQLIEQPDDVDRYALLYDMLRAVALSPEKSHDLIADVAREDYS